MHPESQPGPATIARKLGERARRNFRAIRDGVRRNHSQKEPPLQREPGDARAAHVKRRRRRWFIGTILVLLAYPVLGTLFLETGLFERVVRSEDLRVELQKPAWTLWPGHFHVAGARVLSNGDTQFKLEAKNLVVHVVPFSLLRKYFHVTALDADDVRYWMRVQVENKKGAEERLAAYPPLNDLPGNPTVEAPKARATEKKRGKPFTVQVEGIDVRVSDLWFMEYHYVGPGTLRGGFLVGPNRMRVATSVQHLGPGELRFGPEQVIADQFGGTIQVEIPELKPKEHANESFLELVSSNVFLKGHLKTLAHLGAYLHGMKVVGGAGPFETQVLLSKGALGDTSRFKYSTDKVGVRGKGFGVDTDIEIDANVGKAPRATGKAPGKDERAPSGEREITEARTPSDESVLPRIHSRSRASYVSLSNPEGAIFTVELAEHAHEVVLKTNRLGTMTDIDHAQIRFPVITTHDMDDLSALASKQGGMKAEGGEARASLAVDVDAHHVAKGPLRATVSDLRLDAGGMQFWGHADLACALRADLDHEVGDVRDLSLRIADLGMKAGDEHVKSWWATIDVPSFESRGLPPKQMEGHVKLRAKSAEPLLKGLADKDRISSIIPDLTNLNDLRAQGTIRKDPKTTDVMLDPLENTLFDLAGRYYARGKESRMAFVVGGKAVSLGIAKDDSGTTLKPFAHEDWLNSELSHFPKPAEKVHAPQP